MRGLLNTAARKAAARAAKTNTVAPAARNASTTHDVNRAALTSAIASASAKKNEVRDMKTTGAHKNAAARAAKASATIAHHSLDRQDMELAVKKALRPTHTTEEEFFKQSQKIVAKLNAEKAAEIPGNDTQTTAKIITEIKGELTNNEFRNKIFGQYEAKHAAMRAAKRTVISPADSTLPATAEVPTDYAKLLIESQARVASLKATGDQIAARRAAKSSTTVISPADSTLPAGKRSYSTTNPLHSALKAAGWVESSESIADIVLNADAIEHVKAFSKFINSPESKITIAQKNDLTFIINRITGTSSSYIKFAPGSTGPIPGNLNTLFREAKLAAKSNHELATKLKELHSNLSPLVPSLISLDEVSSTPPARNADNAMQAQLREQLSDFSHFITGSMFSISDEQKATLRHALDRALFDPAKAHTNRGFYSINHESAGLTAANINRVVSTAGTLAAKFPGKLDNELGKLREAIDPLRKSLPAPEKSGQGRG